MTSMKFKLKNSTLDQDMIHYVVHAGHVLFPFSSWMFDFIIKIILEYSSTNAKFNYGLHKI